MTVREQSTDSCGVHIHDYIQEKDTHAACMCVCVRACVRVCVFIGIDCVVVGNTQARKERKVQGRSAHAEKSRDAVDRIAPPPPPLQQGGGTLKSG